MPDFDAITTAIAARYSAANVTPPAGYDNVKVSTGDLPGQMLPLPAVLTYPNGGEFRHYPGKRDATHEFIVRFYYNQTGDLEHDTIALRKWLTVLVGQLSASLSLGGIVTSAHVVSWQVAVLSYAGLDYTGIELVISVVTNEPWSPGG